MDLNKRLLLAIVLSLFILFGFSVMFPQPKRGVELNSSSNSNISSNNIDKTQIQNSTSPKSVQKLKGPI